MALRYAVRLPAPATHLVEIELRVPVGDAPVELALPAWCPGSYLIRDYARFVRDLTVTADDGTPRDAVKRDKQTWAVEPAGARELIVRYAVYGHDLTVRTNHIDETHAFLHGPATFLYPLAARTDACEVRVEALAGWDVLTALPARDGVYHAQHIDELFDSPFHIGPVALRTIPARSPVRLAIWGERAPGGTFDERRLVEDLAAIVDDHCARLGATPYANYTFILMLAHDAYGGLEHRASSVNLYHPHFAASRKAYEGLLELLSHEFFHVWNGKRIAPAPLLHFDYAREAYTPCLWVMEGITSHYDRFALRTSGRITAKSLLDKVLDDWTRLVATPGRTRQSLEASSFDAWIKLYKPDESNLNTTVSYYLKGGLAMFALDLQIRRRTEGQRSLDDALRALWTHFGARGEPHPDDVQPIFEEAVGLSLSDVFTQQIRGTADPELADELRFVGLELRSSADPAQIADGASALWLGATLAGVKVTGVFDGSPAQAAGLSPGDELIAIDGFRTTGEGDVRSLAGARRPGDAVELSVFRRHRLLRLPLVLAVAPPTRYEIAAVADPGEAAGRYERWIGEPHPSATAGAAGAQVLASVTTAARWV
ncbi:MAG TPA: PDZ domain-containing protein [Kofleriaceae bacterium]|jgi:predicted metalloprotease with PDZ domain